MMRRARLALGIAIFLAGIALIGGPHMILCLIALASGAFLIKTAEL